MGHTLLSQITDIVNIVGEIDQRKENRLKPKTKVNHMNTRTTIQTNEIVDTVAKELSKVGEDIIKLLDRNFTIPEIKTKLKEKVGTIIASGIRESYFLGFKFVEKFEQKTIPLTPIYLKQIDDTIATQIDAFWKSIPKMVQTQKKTIQKITGTIASAAGPNDLLLLNLFNKSFSNSAISMNFFALSQATATARIQVFKKQVKLSKNKSVKVTGSIKVPQNIWVSERDNRVCPICLNLDGRTWAVNDSTMPRPVQDSHLGCRCRLLPISDGKVFNA